MQKCHLDCCDSYAITMVILSGPRELWNEEVNAWAEFHSPSRLQDLHYEITDFIGRGQRCRGFQHGLRVTLACLVERERFFGI